VDSLYVFNVNEAVPDFLSYQTEPVGRDAYAISCCYPANRAWITTSLGELQYIDVTTPSTAAGSLNLVTTLDTGGNLSHAEVNHIAILGTQAFLSREYGGVMVANLDKVGDTSGATPVDYFIGDIPNPRGIVTDGTLIYVVSEGDDGDGNYVRQLLVLNPASLTPLTGNVTTVQLDKNDDGLLVVAINVGQFPQEVLLSTAYAFVTNQNDDTVSVIDRATYAVVATITVGDQPFSLGLYTTPADGDRYVYVGNVFSNTLSIIDIPTLAVAGTYP
jgi:YVTN family beta-propeller protein